MKTILRNKIHFRGASHDTTIVQAGTKKFKLTYEAGNAYERYTGELFDGEKLNHLFCLQDLGDSINCSAYSLLNEKEREKRVNELYKKAVKFLNALF